MKFCQLHGHDMNTMTRRNDIILASKKKIDLQFQVKDSSFHSVFKHLDHYEDSTNVYKKIQIEFNYLIESRNELTY